MKKITILALALLSLFTIKAHADEIWVDIVDFSFQPQHLFVMPGTTVTWTNWDAVGHTVTDDGGIFDSGILSTGQSWSYTFASVGDFSYHCTPHPMMVAEVHVRDSAQLDFLFSITPSVTPVVIPPTGGSIDFTITVTNQTPNLQTFDYWTKIYLPNNSRIKLIGPVNYQIAGNRTASKGLNQFIPGGAPAGTYRYVTFIGTYPDFGRAWDSFEFEKQAAGSLDNWDLESTTEWVESTTTSAVSAENVPTTEVVKLWNAPEPFNPTTMINYVLPSDGQVRLEVYDLRGANVATLVNNYVSAGQHQATFDASHLASGTYFYRLSFAGETISNKMLLVK
ncbi:MAG: plastocyanin/azurin family copper-binding protein [bacterium]